MEAQESIAPVRDKEVIWHDEVVARITEKAAAQGIENILEGVRSPDHFSSIEIALIADQLGTSVHWLITGERDPYEIRLVHCTGKYPFDEEDY